MITISQLAAFAGVTVAAVRHYHKIGLLPEPERTYSGYRIYDAAAVVRLIRIGVLAGAGVPLARVDELLDADPDEFAAAIDQIDARLRVEIGQIQTTRKRLARLAAGEQLALPDSVIGYLDRLRAVGVAERYIELERDAWIITAAQAPDQIDTIIALKHAQLDDPDVLALYRLLSDSPDWSAEDPRIEQAAELLDRIFTRAEELPASAIENELDDRLVDLLDSTVVKFGGPAGERLIELLEQRGWQGWTRTERIAKPAG